MKRLVLFGTFLVLSAGFDCDRPRQGQITIEPEPAEPSPAEPERPVPEKAPPTPDKQPDAGPTTPAASLAVPAELAKAINALGVDLYGRMRATSGNIALSPASITVALAMTYGGARGETAAQMAKTLHFDMDAEALHGHSERFVKSVGDTGQRPYTLHLANRLFGEKTYEFEAPFLTLTRERYDAELEGVDFKNAHDAARQHINSWVAGETRDRIQDLLPAPAINSGTGLVLVNALYFHGPWSEPFTESRTEPAAFHLSATEQGEVPFMHRTGDYRYAQAEGVTLLGLPYAGNELQMTIVLPNEREGLAAIEQSMTAETLSGWLAALSSMERVAVSLPRFTIQPAESLPLKPALSALGMPLPFEPTADFTGMANPENAADHLYISNIFHKAFVEVTEAGTEAAAATAVVMALRGGIAAESAVFNADHPFLFFIHNRETNAVLFMGRLADPR